MRDKKLKEIPAKTLKNVKAKVYLQLIPGNGATLVTRHGGHLKPHRGLGALLLTDQFHGGQPLRID